MAFAPQVTAPDVTTPGQVTSSAAFTPTANGLQIVGGGVTGALASQNSIQVSSTHAGQGAWTVIQWTTTAASQCSAFIAVSKTGPNPGSGTVSVTLGAAPVGESWFPSEIPDGFDPNNIAVGAATAGAGTTATTPAVTLTTAPAAGDIVLATFASRNDPNLVTPGPGFTAVGQANGTANPRVSVLREWNTGTTSPTVTAASMGTVYNAGAALIVKAAPGGTPTTYQASSASAATTAVLGAVTAVLLAGGVVAGTSGTSGTATRVPQAYAVTGTVSATSSAAGSADRVLRTFPASGTIAATSGTSGSPSLVNGPATLPAAGTIAATSTTAGTATATLTATGTTAAVVAIVGDVTVTVAPVTHQAAGTVAASSGTTGAATIHTATPARDLRVLATSVPTLAWSANAPASAWQTTTPAHPTLPTTTPASAWATTLPEH